MNDPTNLAIEAISASIVQLESIRDFGYITPEQLESLQILNACYELIARTKLIESQTVIPSEDMIETEEDRNPWPTYMHSSGAIDDFMFKIITRQGQISLRSFLSNLINRAKFSDRKLNQMKIAEAIGIRQATISNFLNGKNMTTDNLEKIINCTQLE